jgi:AraC-like DNA-binding protein
MRDEVINGGGERRQRLVAIREEIAAIVVRHLGRRREAQIPGTHAFIGKVDAPMAPTTYQYEPCLCIAARGKKRVVLGGEQAFVYGGDRFLLNAVGVPAVMAIPEASTAAPFVALQVRLDLDVARQVMAEMDAGGIASTAAPEPCMSTGPLDEALADALLRLTRLAESARDAAIVAPLIEREIAYRVLAGPKGERLRQVARLGSQGQRVAKAVTFLRANFKKKVPIEELARVSGMGLSTLHRHFLELTTMSPLRFQKQLRLHEARRLMLAEELDAASSAVAVGYESAAQFSREYRRLFGRPPASDVKALRALEARA